MNFDYNIQYSIIRIRKNIQKRIIKTNNLYLATTNFIIGVNFLHPVTLHINKRTEIQIIFGTSIA